ncbi:hypothetical protein GDO81_019414 [Engystomops pustulosus]|uniref:Uncharacterized protein n=1 Tax=Engystomops pustulosus TaxID=76066 RepID=A0AAV6YZ25_ENGPU|nr:hypothetical protein GDO81_019414 [Engystomops pustulosus]
MTSNIRALLNLELSPLTFQLITLSEDILAEGKGVWGRRREQPSIHPFIPQRHRQTDNSEHNKYNQNCTNNPKNINPLSNTLTAVVQTYTQ